MTIELSLGDIDTILESLEHSKRAVRDGGDAPYDVRTENLKRIDAVAAVLRAARQANKDR